MPGLSLIGRALSHHQLYTCVYSINGIGISDQSSLNVSYCYPIYYLNHVYPIYLILNIRYCDSRSIITSVYTTIMVLTSL